VNVIFPFRADELQTTPYHRHLKMYEVIDGVARCDAAGSHFTYDGTTHTIDGQKPEERDTIIDRLAKYGNMNSTNNPHYLCKDWLFAQLVFWQLSTGTVVRITTGERS
jgi:hypothetical protein